MAANTTIVMRQTESFSAEHRRLDCDKEYRDIVTSWEASIQRRTRL